VPYFYLTSLRLRDLPGPPRSPFKGHTSSPQPLLGHSCPQSRFPLLLARYNINPFTPNPTLRPILTQVLHR
ncbi:uncharacterized protein C8R40DRAFT_1104383, partial [Lentinula edodes]|uniref:uncharacterized protein n=1 Tax=Lentinula edodes TaxID=5353 RepID=UPI001E8E5FB7